MKASGPKNTTDTLETLEAAFSLLRRTPFSAWTLYAGGTVPFLCLLLHFYVFMTGHPRAAGECAPLSGLLLVSYLCMKTAHGEFGRRLIDLQAFQSSPPLSLAGLVLEWLRQCRIQAVFFASLPFVLGTMLGFGWIHAFFEHLSLQRAGSLGFFSSWPEAWKQAKAKPLQNHLLIWLASPQSFVLSIATLFLTFYLMFRWNPALKENGLAGLFLAGLFFLLMALVTSPLCTVMAGNIALLLISAPWILNTFFGIETQASLSGFHILNGTFLLAVTALTYASMRPLSLAIYALRHFQLDSVTNGADLRASALVHFPAKTTVIAALCLGSLMVPFSSRAQTSSVDHPHPPVSEKDLAASIEKTLAGSSYLWRSAPDSDSSSKGILGSFFESLGSYLEKAAKNLQAWAENMWNYLREWLERLVPEKKEVSSPMDGGHLIGAVKWILIALIALIFIAALILMVRSRFERRLAVAEAIPADAVRQPDLENESTTADQLPADDWMKLAETLLQQGECRLALRAMYLSLLVRLASSGALVIHPSKSNRDYLREFAMRTRRAKAPASLFSECISMFERCWYGTHPADLETINAFKSRHAQISEQSS